jgi:hypothetical protein
MVHDHPGTMQKRIEVRQAHLSVVGNNKAVVAGGKDPPDTRSPQLRGTKTDMAGAFFSKDPTPEDPMPFAVLVRQRGCGANFRGV